MQVIENKNQEIQVLPTLREMQIGEKVSFPASKNTYVKSACANYGFQWNMKFSTRANHETRSVEVTRIS